MFSEMGFGQKSSIKFDEMEEETEENNIRDPAPADSGKRENDKKELKEKQPSPLPVPLNLRKTTCSTAGILLKGFVMNMENLPIFLTICAFSMMDIYDPTTFQETMELPNAQKLWEAAQAEYDSLIKNETWELVLLPEERNTVSHKWVFKMKQDKDKDQYKERLFVKRILTGR